MALLTRKATAEMVETELTAAQRLHFDRQIELFGGETQAKLLRLSIAVIGVGGASGEVCKNAVLSGVGRVYICEFDGEATERDFQFCCLYDRFHLYSNGATKHRIIEDGLKAMSEYVKIVFVNAADAPNADFVIYTPKNWERFETFSKSQISGLQFYIFEAMLGGVILLAEGDDLPLPSKQKLESAAPRDALLAALCDSTTAFNSENSIFPLSAVIGSLVNQSILLRLTKGPLSYNALTFNFAFGELHPLKYMKTQTYLLV